MNEWEFTAAVADWMNEIIRTTPGLRFSEARCEQRSKGSSKRRDLTLLDKDRRPILTGEVKLPYRKDGNTPLNTAVVSDARSKARRAKVSYFFTWNVNNFVLWPTESRDGAWEDRNYRTWQLANVRNEPQLGRPDVERDIRKWLKDFLLEFTRIIVGEAEIGHRAPDEKFVDMLETSLANPIHSTFEELLDRYKTQRFKKELDQWMTKEQNWVILNDEAGIRDNLERAAKFSCYSLVNKLVFHEALLKRYSGRIRHLSVPKHVTTGEDLRTRIDGYFAKAKQATGDYETVFGEDHTTIGNRIPFYSDQAVSFWRELISEIHQYDFTALEHDVIGTVFERLLGPEERKKFGQFYTMPEIVDIINSFCIHTGNEKVMDPACGSGTFLVRAYGRKRELAPGREHNELLTDLYGVDIARYATEWTTINLTTRDLVEAENYPRVVRKDFFDVAPHAVAMSLPKHVVTKGLGKIQHQEIQIPDLDAVVGNLPYIRQEQIRKAKNKSEPGTKVYYQHLTKTESQLRLSGRSDIHCYFWPHAAQFLKDDGYLCFLTSSQWLDVEYGFRLQEWILRNFKIVAVFESIDEPWFVGARVATTVTILKRHSDEAERMANTVRFVQLRRSVRDLFANDGTMAGALRAVDGFREEILALTENTVNERYRARLVRQGDLWEEGVRLGEVMKKSDSDDEEDEQAVAQYYGGKWGVYLRAPDLWFELIDKYGEHLVPLGEIADIRRGITSGNDSFFFPIDCSEECLLAQPTAKAFEGEYGVPRSQVKSGNVKLVKCGEGHTEIRPIEAEFLEPELHNLMEIDGFTVSAENCSRMILLVNQKKSKLRGKYVLDYIKWGEEIGVHRGSTCSSRASEEREWYDLTGHNRGSMFWPMIQKYKHAIPINKENLICNHNLFDITPQNATDSVFCGILNSSIVILSKYQHGRYAGTEGTLKTEVVDTNMMLVPDPRQASKASLKRISDTFSKMKKRNVLQLLSEKRLRRAAFTAAGRIEEWERLSDQSELDMPDRRELDDAVFEMMGVSSKACRNELITLLYSSLHELLERNKQIEEKANLNKIISKRKGAARPEDIAAQILADIAQNTPEFLRRYPDDFLDPDLEFDPYEVPADGEPRYEPDMISDKAVTFFKSKTKRAVRIETRGPRQAELLSVIAASGVRGFVSVPHDEKECRKLLNIYKPFIIEREAAVRNLIEERTADEDLQEKIYNALLPKILHYKPTA